jgi:hypothetical protein
MDRRTFLNVLGGAAIAPAVAGCSSALPFAALQAWDQPGIRETDVRRWALSYAILAPHSHNLQSWIVDLRTPGEIVLGCDLTRLLPETDPFSRQIMMSHGTFLEVLSLAARERGHRADVELFPEGEFGPQKPDTRPVARIRLVPDASQARDPLFAQVVRRHTNREAYDLRDPAPAALQAILAAAAAAGLRSGVTTSADAASLQRQRAIAAQAWRIELTTPRTIMESYRLLRVGPAEIAQHRDGLVINSPMLRAMDTLGLFDRSRPPGPADYATTSQLKQFDARLQATPAFFWLGSDANDRRTQVNAGRAYVRAQLAATAHGLSMQPLSQALQEYPEQAQPYRDIHALFGANVVQMWARLGYGPAIGASPRRGLDAHVVTA